MDPEPQSSSSERCRTTSFRRAFLLAYQSLGVVYGDLSISPMYVYSNTFYGKMRFYEEDTEIMGVLSLTFWTLTLIALLKYIIIVLGADDHGEGGTLALYSKLCSNSKIGLIKEQFNAQALVSSSESASNGTETRAGFLIRSFFEKNHKSRIVLFFLVLLGTSMLVGDGVLTPTMSVLSAVSGIRVKVPELNEEYTVFTACVILVGLFILQHYGTHRIGLLFAPVPICWLGCIFMIGIYNILRWNPLIIQALSPHYIYKYFKDTGQYGWRSLSGVVLCITGAEAMFADLGHFSKLSLRMAFTTLVYPSLVLSYFGEAAYISKHKDNLRNSFYRSIPDSIFWPVFVIATLNTIVSSQATISATFSVIGQCRALNCFPRVKIIHTSNDVHGQIYIPEVNWLMLLLCLSVTIAIRDTTVIRNAYGLAVIIVMFITTCLMSLVITIVWKRTIFFALLFFITFGSLELLYFSACVTKVPHGGWIPLSFSLAMLSIMATWHYGNSRKLLYEAQNKLQIDDLVRFGESLSLVRVPGICLVYSTIPEGIPPMFSQFITNIPAFHRILIFVSLQTMATPNVPLDKQFMVHRLSSPKHHIFHCIARYGYKDTRGDVYGFEERLLAKIAEFALQDGLKELVANRISELQRDDVAKGMREREEVGELFEQREVGVTYMIGNVQIVAHEMSSLWKKMVINHGYGFLRRNCRQPGAWLGIPPSSMIQIGMVYRV